MSDIIAYLAEIEVALVSSPVVAEYQVVRSWSHSDDGYIRIRATLTNGDFLEAAEYFVLEQGQIATVDYRHHWTDEQKQTLRRRWDSTPDHPELENFPHHIHVGDEGNVASYHPVGIMDVLKLIEAEILKT